MANIKLFARRLFGGSFKRMFMNMNFIHEETGKNRFVMFFDMIWCIFRYSAGYHDYQSYGFAYIKGKARKTFLTMKDNDLVRRTLTQPDKLHYIADKGDFDRYYEKYLHRGYVDLRHSTKEDLIKFCEGKDAVFAKQVDDCGGHGISKEPLGADVDLDALYQKLIDNKQYLIEEVIVQHESLNRLCPASINTLRVTTLNYNGNIRAVYTLMRIGNGINCVDNISSGGMYIRVYEDGILHGVAVDEINRFDRHPVTGVVFEGFEIPFYKETVEMCKQAAAEEPGLGYVGWDVAITPNGPALVEGNNQPGYTLPQNYVHLREKVGIKPIYEEVLGKDFFRRK